MSNELKNMRELLNQGLFSRLRTDANEEWEHYIHHRFVHELALGTLDLEEFKQYLIQDYLYVLDYCRVQALAIYKSAVFEEMKYFSFLLHGILTVELPLHLSYCKEWNIDIYSIDKSPRSIELIAYGQYILNKAMQGDLLELVLILLPCLVGYVEIGLNISQTSRKEKNNPFQHWIDLYSSNQYSQLGIEAVGFFEKIAQNYGAEGRYPQLLQQFKMVVKLETAFWEVGRSKLL